MLTECAENSLVWEKILKVSFAWHDLGSRQDKIGDSHELQCNKSYAQDGKSLQGLQERSYGLPGAEGR